MSVDLNKILKSKAINGWRLFWLIAIPMSLAMVIEMMSVDLSTGPGVSSMIGYSVRFAVPFIFLVVATSSLQILVPGPVSMWLLRNRKQIGLCFAVAMAWQGFFIFLMSNFYNDYYYADIYLLRDELEGSIGYIFLSAMVITSFQFTRRRLTPRQWKLIHKSGLYFLFAYPFSVYWWNTSYYPNPQAYDFVFYGMGLLAFLSRIAAWGKMRLRASEKSAPDGRTPLVLKVTGGVIVAFGLLASVTGVRWQESVTTFMTTPKWSADLVLWLPYWPLEPYLPLFIVGFGTLLMTRGRA